MTASTPTYTSASPRLKDRVAIVTGGASGIGRAISLAFAQEGAKVIIADLQPNSRLEAESASPTHELIISNGGESSFIKTDVTDSISIDSLVTRVVEKWGRLDIMVNNAGIAVDTDKPPAIWETSNASFDKTLSINTYGVFYGVRAAARQMIKQEPLPNGDRGWIINMASIFGLVGVRTATPYVTSKHAVMGLTKTAAIDLGPHRVHCNAICPGYVESALSNGVIEKTGVRAALDQLHPMKGIGMPEDVSRIAVFLASDDARWVSGTGITTDGGYTAQ